MPLLFMVLFLVVMPLISTSFESESVTREEILFNQSNSLGGNMLVLRNTLQTHLETNPVASGEIALNDLELPTWYIPSSDLRIYIENGRAFIYFVPINTKPDLVSVFGNDPPGLAGIAHQSQLISPRWQNATITLPSIIPDNSIVLML